MASPSPPLPFTVALLGNTMLARLIDETHPSFPRTSTSVWGEPLVRRLLDADVRVTSLECRASSRASMPRVAVSCLNRVFDAVSLANSHALDGGVLGLEETMSALDAVGIVHAGAGADAAAAFSGRRFEVSLPATLCPEVMVPLPLRVSLLSFADPRNALDGDGTAHAHGLAGIACLEVSDSMMASSLAAVKSAITHERAAGAELIILAPHWGASYVPHIPHVHTRFAHAAIEGGVDVVFCTSAQHPLPIELVRRAHGPPGVIVWGTGGGLGTTDESFRHDASFRHDVSFLVLLEMTRGSSTASSPSLRSIELIPLRLHATSTIPLLCTGTDAPDWQMLRTRLTHACARHGGAHVRATCGSSSLCILSPLMTSPQEGGECASPPPPPPIGGG